MERVSDSVYGECIGARGVTERNLRGFPAFVQSLVLGVGVCGDARWDFLQVLDPPIEGVRTAIGGKACVKREGVSKINTLA